MKRLFLACALIAFGMSKSPAREIRVPFCIKVCNYVNFPLDFITHDFNYCVPSGISKLTPGESCLCAYRSKANKVGTSFHYGAVTCLHKF